MTNFTTTPEPEPAAQELAAWLVRAELYRDKQIYFVLPVEDSIHSPRQPLRVAGRVAELEIQLAGMKAAGTALVIAVADELER